MRYGRNRSRYAAACWNRSSKKSESDYFSPPLAYDDPRWTSYRLAEVLPLGLEEKQGLLELRDDGARLEQLHSYLKQAA